MGRPFYLYKFRTMKVGKESDAERLTKWGRFLRSTSLDELPELWNVLIGEMSLVGPRPLPSKYKERYSKNNIDGTILPGITGWAQINGEMQSVGKNNLNSIVGTWTTNQLCSTSRYFLQQ